MKKIPQFRPKSSGAKKFTKKSPYKTYDWVEFRNLFLQHNPRCYSCGNRATVCDHIVPHKGDNELFWKSDNIIPLCKLCHDTCTGLFDQFALPKTEEKLEWLYRQRLKNEINIRVKVISPKIK